MSTDAGHDGDAESDVERDARLRRRRAAHERRPDLHRPAGRHHRDLRLRHRGAYLKYLKVHSESRVNLFSATRLVDLGTLCCFSNFLEDNVCVSRVSRSFWAARW